MRVQIGQRLKHQISQPKMRSFASDLFPWLLLAFTYLLAVLFQAKYGDDFLNSDMAAEMILAKELNDSNRLFLTKDWFYPSELRVLYQHITFRLGLYLFPNNWHWARVLGQAIMLALHAGSFIYLMSVLGHKKAGIYGAAALMCPMGFWYLFHGVFTGAYLTHMILMSMTIGLVIALTVSRSTKKQLILGISLAVLCFFQGLNGVRMLMSLFVPLCITAVLVFFLRHMRMPLEAPLHRDPHFRLVCSAVFASLVCCAGYLVHSVYLSKAYDCVTYENVYWTSFSLTNLIDSWSRFLRIFGYPNESWAGGLSYLGWNAIPLMSINGILGAAGIVLMITVVFSMFRLFKLWDRLSMSHQVIAMLLPVCLVVDGVVFSCLTGYQHTSYWLPLVPLTFANVTIWILNEDFRLSTFYRRLVSSALFLCLICASVPVAYQFIHFPPRSPINIKPAVQWLLENDYSQGYASFWYSSVITEHANGQIEMWTLSDTSEVPFSHTLNEMLQKRSHAEFTPEGRCFVLMSQEEYDECIENFPYAVYDNTIVYNHGGYVILSYDSIEQALK